jgi:hypothetical protein
MVILQGLPFFAANTATTDIYVNVLELIALLQIDDIEQEEGKILFLQDGVPPHFSHELLNALDVRFPTWWIGRERRTSWPTCSQDFSLLDFFSGGLLKILFNPLAYTASCETG